jgi:AcrR family transcriptional regulator
MCSGGAPLCAGGVSLSKLEKRTQLSKRLKASERKAAILAVAKVLFSDKGYHGVSVDEIARRVGVSPAILYRHFPSKEALYEEVLNQIACKRESYVEAVVQSDGSFSEVLRMITRRYVQSVSRDPDYLRMELQSALEGSDATRQFFENRWRPFTDYIEVTIRELQPTGAVQQTDGRIAALMFQGMLREALYAKCIFRTPRYQELELNELTDYLVTLFFRAIGYQEDTG